MINSLCSLENLHLNVCNGFLHKQQKSEWTHKCLWWIDKQAMIHPYKWTLLSNKCKQASNNQQNLDESQIYYAKWKELYWKCLIPFMWHAEKAKKKNSSNGKQISELAGDWWKAGYNYQKTPENLGGWYNFYILILVVAVYYVWASLVA